MGGIETETMLFVGMLLAMGAGALSFLSPCVLPIFPAYMSYITGISVKELQGDNNPAIRRKLLTHALIFLVAVSLVYVALGLSVSYLGQWGQDLLFGSWGTFIQRIAGVFIVLMGLFVGGWIDIPFLMKEKRIQSKAKPVGYLGTFFAGLGFAAGWTPCIGPMLGSILAIVASNPGQGMFYISMYVVGFALPFLVLTFFLGSTKWLVRHSGIIMKIGAVIMIIMGILLFFGLISMVTGFLLDLIEGTGLEKLG